MTILCRLAVIIVAGFILAAVQPAVAQDTGTPKIRILDPPKENETIRASGGTYDLTFVVENDPNDKVGKVFVRTDNGIGTDTSFLDVDPNIEKYELEVKLFEDINTITIYTALNGTQPDKGSQQAIAITCKSSKCTKSGTKAGVKIIKGGGAGGARVETVTPPATPGTGRTGGRTGGKDEGKVEEQTGDTTVKVQKNGDAITIKTPDPDKTIAVYNEDEVLVRFSLSPAARGKKVEGEKEENDPEAKDIIEAVYVTATSPNAATRQVKIPIDRDAAEQTQLIGVAKGINVITVTDADEKVNEVDPENPKEPESASVKIECLGNCGGSGTPASGSSSLYTRALLGFQQSGVSAGKSEQKPFIDFFFGAPLGGKIGGVPPRVSLWGNVRMTSLPQQVLAANTAINNFGSALTTNSFPESSVNDIVQGFEFLAGVDIRLFPFRRKSQRSQEGFPGLSANTLEKTSLSLVISGGAINPFTQTPSARFFGLPKTPTGEVNEEALRQIPGLTAAALAGKDTIALVTPERDRFLRQYYAGLRLKTFYYDRKSDQPINRFPAMIDILFGRNESVTGNLKKNVFRLEGFVPLPFRDASFIYLFGTATLKLGGTPRTFLPLTLPPPPVLANGNSPSPSDPNVIVVPINRIESLRSTRDFYNFGIGFNLLELLNRRNPPANQAAPGQ
jgi:hypothetical protein